ncbi:pyridoxamine 5'-phosphate oxidase family protein [Antrihabitans cavernicola]|uniref:Pyridoxamine 5'-phosphate oxidase family protein n=1 Tax=Antrihabitans cavernicola TaxID=2495913 RepID=A0A5A7SBJ7_9NOCA|nr:pyridoxamine 5'-phosphate oxidase family protein [Spelaeibacter cavernicola]KAA0022924.1 pyridoxamine 5'-phosphate oxidase family protein [Spelaeibacter cavernicola]
MALTRTEREKFLSEPHIAALSVDAGPDRAPLTVPIWYQYLPGGQPWVLTGKTSKKAELIRAAGRFTLMVERLEPSVRYVSVSGTVDRIDEGTHEQLREMTSRYLPADKVDGYLEFAKNNLEDEVAIYLRPEHWLSADMGSA